MANHRAACLGRNIRPLRHGETESHGPTCSNRSNSNKVNRLRLRNASFKVGSPQWMHSELSPLMRQFGRAYEGPVDSAGCEVGWGTRPVCGADSKRFRTAGGIGLSAARCALRRRGGASRGLIISMQGGENLSLEQLRASLEACQEVHFIGHTRVSARRIRPS
jgi:hypothetical protein